MDCWVLLAGRQVWSTDMSLRNTSQSHEIARKLQESVDLRSIYSADEADYWSRLDPDVTFEDFFSYYLSRIDVYFDPEANVVHLDVQAYRPADAQRIAAEIVRLSDDMVNRISEQSRTDAVEFAAEEVTLAENRLRDNRLTLYRFREEHGELDPVRSAEAIGGIVSKLEEELARYKTELASLRSYMREESAQVAGVKARIGAIEQQLRAERGRLTSSPDDPATTYSDLLADYERLLIEDAPPGPPTHQRCRLLRWREPMRPVNRPTWWHSSSLPCRTPHPNPTGCPNRCICSSVWPAGIRPANVNRGSH